MVNEEIKNLENDFVRSFEAELTLVSPGRINFIGEHTDYNQGFVLPTAIDRNITFSFKRNGTASQCKIYSVSYDEMLVFDLSEVAPSKIEWENYILGVVHELLQLTTNIRGFDCIIKSELPIGAGVSSSAALECGLAVGLNQIFDLQLRKIELVELSQRAEHTYIGTKCGIMDQFASVMSEDQKVILLDCKNQDYRLIDAAFEPYKILLLNTNVSHNLATSEYNTRREECESVVKIISLTYPHVTSLRDVSKEHYNRALYVLQENDRVQQAVMCLESNDLVGFGSLMYQSHHGLQHQYEVSCQELDFLVDFSKQYKEVVGARMMGGGFGGCTINLIHQDAVETYIKEAKKAYKNQFGIDLTSFLTVPSQGTTIIQANGKF